MDSSEIISNIHSVYSKFDLPSNLRMHCFRTASISELVCENWSGPEIDKEDVVATLLLHDLGNLIKYDFSSTSLLAREDAMNLDYWKQKQKETVAKYGSSETEATLRMAEEIGISERMMFLLKGHEGIADWVCAVLGSSDWEMKIIAYSDCRVSPSEVVGIKERFDDLIKRRKGKPIEETYKKLYPSVVELEKQLSEKMSIAPSQINDKSIEKHMQKYNKVKLRTTY
jgi:hypothetical protein